MAVFKFKAVVILSLKRDSRNCCTEVEVGKT